MYSNQMKHIMFINLEI